MTLESVTAHNISENGVVPNENGDSKESKITYGMDDNPPWYMCFFLAIQHYLTMIGAIVSIPFILTPALCMEDESPARGQIISTMIFVTGIVTLLQATFGCRLPIVQGGTISFLVPILAILHLPKWQCPAKEEMDRFSEEEKTEIWQLRMREISGAIAVAALVQVVMGLTGMIGRVVKIITPLTIVPTVSLVGLTLFEHAAKTAAIHWGIAVSTTALLTLFSQVMTNVVVPIFVFRKSVGLQRRGFGLFKLFPVLLTIGIMWGICGILTIFEVFPEGHQARTDARLNVLSQSSWFRVPYPGQFGAPTVTLAGVLGMLAGVLACTVESISYYPTVSRMCEAESVPLHAMNRGIAVEGIGTVLAGLFGSGNGTNTFGENVGAIGITKVGSRRVIQWAAGIMIVQGVISKFGAVFIMIPDPVVGGIFCVMFGMIAAFGLSALQYVDLKSARNLYILGLSIFFPLVLCLWLQKNPGAIQTGNETVDSTLSVLLGTSILVGGVIGCVLDHSIPGTPEERGLVAWGKELNIEDSSSNSPNSSSTYDFPIGMSLLKRWKWTEKVPFLPTYKPALKKMTS